jgi:hypothetical protein
MTPSLRRSDMDTSPNFTIPGDPLIEIARAIGRIEALVGTALARQSDHEARINKLEDVTTKLNTKITVYATVAGAAVSVGAWLAEHWFLK